MIQAPVLMASCHAADRSRCEWNDRRRLRPSSRALVIVAGISLTHSPVPSTLPPPPLLSIFARTCARARVCDRFINVWPVSADGGPTAVVPHSHRLDHGPLETLGRSYQSSMTLDAELSQSSMPNHFRFASDAGDALIFDMATCAMASICLACRRPAYFYLRRMVD
jgi:hypothetical protein